jgi:hypothetical protein
LVEGSARIIECPTLSDEASTLKVGGSGLGVEAPAFKAEASRMKAEGAPDRNGHPHFELEPGEKRNI